MIAREACVDEPAKRTMRALGAWLSEDLELVGEDEPLRDIVVNDDNPRLWEGWLHPDASPYSKGAFNIQIEFPELYPFRPPTVTFKTKIYHPNVSKDGRLHISSLDGDLWRPGTTCSTIITDILAVLKEPERTSYGNVEAFTLFILSPDDFWVKAEHKTAKHALPRVDDD